jgi:ribosome biogenesis GTPase
MTRPISSASALAKIGWDATFDGGAAAGLRDDPGLFVARAFGDRRGTFTVSDGARQWQARVAGRLRHQAVARADLPVVGDWVICRADGVSGVKHDEATIHAVLPRRTRIVRKVAGDRQDEQVLAANVDTVVILMGLDGDLNQRRLDRFVTMAKAGGARAMVLLTKSDLAEHAARSVADVRALTALVPVARVCLLDGALPEELTLELQPAKTLVLLGSSGVGKSTLINRLLGQEVQRTAAVRGSDSRGRHTTTYRQMFVLSGGALMIDTPGLREIQLLDGDAESGEAFPDIEALEGACRFRDCHHDRQPGCAVAAAVADGRLLSSRLENYHRLHLTRPAGGRSARRGRQGRRA